MDHWSKDGVFKLHSPDRTGWILVEFGTHSQSGLENATVSSTSTPGFFHTFPAFKREQLPSDPRVDSAEGNGASDDLNGADLKIPS